MSNTHSIIEQWGRFELSHSATASGNPFLDVAFNAQFTHENGSSITVEGFYDGEDLYRLRFMPEQPGQWRYQTQSNLPELNGISGVFRCVEASTGNHGPVRVAYTHHFAYADGTPHISIGTTCYAWIHQPETLQRQTLDTLRTVPFNKLRRCISKVL
jgi:hypothetical protein